MSASMHTSVAQAAARLAQQALPMTAEQTELAELRERAAREGVPFRKLCRDWFGARVEARSKEEAPDRPSIAAQAWGRIPMQVRVMLALTIADPAVDNPEHIALSPWGALGDEQRRLLGIHARDIARSLRDAACLI